MKIIVALTSWNKRITQAEATVRSLINQTRKPDLIEFNLDYENFPNAMKDLPVWITEVKKEFPNFNVHFNEIDLKVYAKLMPTIVRHYDDDSYILVTLDDDVNYPPTYLEEIEKNIVGVDWLCTQHDDITQGQYMVYGPNAIKAFALEVDMDLIKNVPLDDHALFWIMQKYKLKRGKKINAKCEDRQEGYSFRRFFIQAEDVSKLKDSSCDYPVEEFEKERDYMRSKGILK